MNFNDSQRARLNRRINDYSSLLRHLPPGEIDPHLSTKSDLILPRVIRAIEKLDAHTYGICDGCGEDIPKERLIAVPAALYCVACQESLEPDHDQRS